MASPSDDTDMSASMISSYAPSSQEYDFEITFKHSNELKILKVLNKCINL